MARGLRRVLRDSSSKSTVQVLWRREVTGHERRAQSKAKTEQLSSHKCEGHCQGPLPRSPMAQGLRRVLTQVQRVLFRLYGERNFRHFSTTFTELLKGTFTTLTELSPLISYFHHFYGTFATCTELSPLDFNFQGFAFRSKGGAFRSNTFAFRSNFFFRFRNFHHFYRTFTTFSELSPLLGCVHFFHVPFATPSRFRFH